MIIARYLTREVLSALVVITTVLLLAFLSQQVVRYMSFVAIGKIPTDILLMLVSFEIPYLLSFLLPLGLYLGIIVAYGRLHADNEMSILQMCGFGNRRLLRITLLLAAFISAIVLVLMLWINPLISAKREQVMSSDKATQHLIETLIPGRFQASPDGAYVMYVEKLSRDKQRAENVFLAQQKKKTVEDEQNRWMLVVANQGYQTKDPNSKGQLFVIADGYRYEGEPGQNDYKITQFKKYTVRLPQNEVRASHDQEETLSTTELWQNYQNPDQAAELQWRISVGLSAFLLAILALPLSTVRPRQGRYLMLLPAILIYIIYINLLFIARHWVEQTKVPVGIGIWWVHGVLLFFILITVLLSLGRGMSFKRT